METLHPLPRWRRLTNTHGTIFSAKRFRIGLPGRALAISRPSMRPSATSDSYACWALVPPVSSASSTTKPLAQAWSKAPRMMVEYTGFRSDGTSNPSAPVLEVLSPRAIALGR